MNGLIHAGLKQQEHVALIADNSPEWYIAALATMQAGAVCIPIDTQFSDKQLKHVLKKSKPKWIFITKDILSRLEKLDLGFSIEAIVLDDKAHKRYWHNFKQQKDEKPQEISPDDRAVIFFTSGTTGAPKGVPLSHTNLLHQLHVLDNTPYVTKKDIILMPLPLHHVYPFTVGLLLPLYLGMQVILPGSLTSQQITKALNGKNITCVIGLPRLYRALYEAIMNRIQQLGLFKRLCINSLINLSAFLFKHFKLRAGRFLLRPLHAQFAPKLTLLLSGGAPLSGSLALKLQDLGWKLATGYGLTETSPLLTLLPPGDHKWESVGKAIEGVSLRIDKSEDSNDENGEVLVKGPNVFKEYLDEPKKTRKAFNKDNWFKTEDRGRIDKEGYLYLAGRTSTLIVTESGENIQPDQVESSYEEHPDIKEIGIVELEGGLGAIVVPQREQVDSSTRERVSEALNEKGKKLPSYQRLKGFEISTSALPRTRLGKIRRHELKDLFEKLKKGKEPSDEEAKAISKDEMSKEDQELLSNSMAHKTWKMLSKRYPSKKLTPDTSFAHDLGVDSLEWLNITLEIKDCCAVMLTQKEIEKIDKIRDLLSVVAKSQGGEDESEVLEKPEEYLTKKDKRWLRENNAIMNTVARAVFRLNRFVFKTYFRLEVKGKKHLDMDKAYLITPNHTSYLDAPALAAALSNQELFKTRWIALEGIMLKNSFMRFITHLARAVPVKSQGAESGLAFGAMVLQQGVPLIWFPEGRISPSGKLQTFQPGIGLLSAHFKIPIIPVHIEGTHQALSRKMLWPRPRKISIHIGKPLKYSELDKKGKGEKDYQRINDALYNHMLKFQKN